MQQHADSLLHNTTSHTQHLYQFQNTRRSSSWEIFDTIPMYYIGVRDETNGKRRQNLTKASWFSFPQYTWLLSRCIQNLKILALIGAEISVTKIFIGERERWKGNDKQEESDSLLHNTMSYPTFVPNFKILSAVVLEKSLTKKKVYTHTQTHTHKYWKNENYIPPVYFVYQGNNKGSRLHTETVTAKYKISE